MARKPSTSTQGCPLSSYMPMLPSINSSLNCTTFAATWMEAPGVRRKRILQAHRQLKARGAVFHRLGSRGEGLQSAVKQHGCSGYSADAQRWLRKASHVRRTCHGLRKAREWAELLAVSGGHVLMWRRIHPPAHCPILRREQCQRMMQRRNPCAHHASNRRHARPGGGCSKRLWIVKVRSFGSYVISIITPDAGPAR